MKNDDNSVMTTETVENKGFEAPCHHVTIGSPLEGESVPTPNDDHGCVLGNKNEDYLDFKEGDRVQHPNYGPGTIEIVSDEVYCQWDELGGTMRLIPEDFQVMTKNP